MNTLMTESETKAREDPKTFTLILTAEQRKLAMYIKFGIGIYFLARHLIKSAVRSLKED